jgi:hypothetical protein
LSSGKVNVNEKGSLVDELTATTGELTEAGAGAGIGDGAGAGSDTLFGTPITFVEPGQASLPPDDSVSKTGAGAGAGAGVDATTGAGADAAAVEAAAAAADTDAATTV